MVTIKEKIIAIIEIYIEKYEYIIQQLYQVAYETTPEAFRLSDKNKIKIVHAKFNEKLFINNSERVFLIYVKDSNLEYEFLDFSDESNHYNYIEYTDDDDFMVSKVLEKLNLNKSDILFIMNSLSIYLLKDAPDKIQFKNKLLGTHSGSILGDMRTLAREHGSQYQKHSNLTSGYYAKNAARYAYSLLDLDPIIKKVNDEDFAYQLDQAIAAYDNSLYMASCATLGVCLETVCKLILVKNGKKVKDSDSTLLDKLSEKLKSEQLISYKDKSRIDVCYKVRNLSSHTSPGKTVQNDCHFILNTIQLLVDEYF